MKIKIVRAPIYLGSGVQGVEQGPDIFYDPDVQNCLNKFKLDLEEDNELKIKSFSRMCKGSRKIKYYNDITKFSSELKFINNNIFLNGDFPFVFGGDHSLALGSLSAANSNYEKLAVIWIDAHPDMNTHKTSNSKNAHGMPLASSIGFGPKKFLRIFDRFIMPENIFIIGARSIDKGELKLLEKTGVNIFPMNEIRKTNLQDLLRDIVTKLIINDYDGIHLSFDLDSIDPKYAPGTGTPVVGGFEVAEAKEILETFLNTKLITSMDFVEYNPKLDTEDLRTKKLVIELLELIFKSLTD